MRHRHLFSIDTDGPPHIDLHYRNAGVAAGVFPDPRPETVPLYRWFDPRSPCVDFYYTTEQNETPVPANHYQFDGVACHVYPVASEYGVPLYHWYHAATGDHYYTTADHDTALEENGYVLRGQICRVEEEPLGAAVPLRRWEG